MDKELDKELDKGRDTAPENDPPLQRISILVEDMRLHLRIPRDSESLLRRAGEEITRTTLLYKAKYPNPSEMPASGYLAMTALDVAARHEELLELEARRREHLLPRLSRANKQLEELIQSALANLPTRP